jgi:NADPH:quinone reductase-like Zn-dependent oxidoreductase
MRAIIIREHGGPERLHQETLPDPVAKPGEVLVQVQAVGLNHLDLWVRRGVPGVRYPLPLIPGSDVAGRVASLGAGVSDLKVGDEVVVAPGVSCGSCPACLAGMDHRCPHYGILGEHQHGGCAELMVAPRVNVLEKPASLSFEQAAAIGIPFLTAWHMLVDRAELQHGETVLVQAGGSGVGSAAIQIARFFQATVITTVGSDAKAELAKKLGAHEVVRYSTQDVAKEVKRLTNGRGADVVVEHVGAATWEGSLKALSWHGRLVICGATTGDKVELSLRHLFFKSQSILGSTMGSKTDFRTVVEHVGAGRSTPVIGKVLPLEDVVEAHRLLEARQVFGRVILNP